MSLIDQAKKDMDDYAAKMERDNLLRSYFEEPDDLTPDEEESLEMVWKAIEIFGWDTFMKNQ
jgi:hypothetical protein